MKKNIINIMDYKDKITYTEEYILKMINDNPENIISMNITDFADSIDASVSSISRLCKKIGFLNYTNFRIYIVGEIHKINNYRNIRNNETLGELDNIVSYSIKETMENKKIIKKISEFIEKININSKFIIHGVGSSSYAGMELSNNLTRVGINARFSPIFDEIGSWISNTKKAKLIIFTDSMKSMRIKRLVEVSDPENTLIITNNKSTHEKNSIHYNTLIVDYSHQTIGSKYSQLIISDIFFVELSKKFDINKINKKAELIIKNF